LKGAKEAFASSRIAIIQLEVGMEPRVSAHTSFEEIRDYLAPKGYFLYGIFNQCRTGKRIRPPAEWNAQEADRYFPSSIHYCDAVFVRADLEDL
jgi:hypothetical protein